jgi:quercetin dioxygenase-like cupin family protein
MKYFRNSPGSVTKTEIKGLSLNYFCGWNIPVRPGEKDFRCEHQKLIIDAGSEDVYHYHKVTYEMFTVEEGTPSAMVNGQTIPLARGEAILMEPGDKHRMVNRTTQTAVLIETRFNVCEGDRHVL